MTPNHADAYPSLCCHDLQSVIKKRLALSKQVLVLSARHFYLRPHSPPSSGPAFPAHSLQSVFTTIPGPLNCTPSCHHACRCINRGGRSNAADGSFDGRSSERTPAITSLLAMELHPDHRHPSRRLDELLDSCVAHLVLLGHEGRIQNCGSGVLKRPPGFTASRHAVHGSICSISVNQILLCPTDHSSPSTLTVAAAPAVVELVARDWLAIVGVKLLSGFGGWRRSEVMITLGGV
jgi:hypothetical protein